MNDSKDSSLNPYDSPRPVNHHSGSEDSVLEDSVLEDSVLEDSVLEDSVLEDSILVDPPQWSHQEHTVIAAGIGLGPSATIPAAVSGLVIVGITLLDSELSFPQSVIAGSVPGVLFVAPMSLGLLVSAVLTCNRVRGVHRWLGWISVPFFSVGALGAVGILFRMLNGDQLIGIEKLVAIASYVMFLTSLALISMFFRIWSKQCKSRRSEHGFEATVLLLVCSIGSVATLVLAPELSENGLAGLALKLGGYQVVTALMVMAIAFRWLREGWKKT